MKKLFYLAAALLISVGANAQKVKDAEVPAVVKDAHSKKFPNSKVEKWEKEGANYEAEFHDKNVETSAVYGSDGKFLESEIEITVSELPKAVLDAATKIAAGKKLDEASKITGADGTVSYEVEINDTDYIFDANGNIIKQEKEKEDKDKD